jgi:hypothetical protein
MRVIRRSGDDRCRGNHLLTNDSDANYINDYDNHFCRSDHNHHYHDDNNRSTHNNHYDDNNHSSSVAGRAAP